MLEQLLRRFIKDADRVQDPKVRERYGTFAGGVGIFLNLCLAAAKLLAGLLSGSIAVTADAFNNLSDAGSSVVTIVGFRLAASPSDREHPFGHGRIEYLAGLFISAAILVVGVELLKSSVEKILHPEEVAFSLVSVGILAASILVKLWMSWFNRTLSRRINSAAMKAVSVDSLTDAVATTAVLVSTVAAHLTGLKLDGITGLLVAGFILYSGFNTAKDSLSPLLGEAPDSALVQEIEQTVLDHPPVVGVHDMIVHDYGPGRRIISLHAEVPSTGDILEMHDVIDHIELELQQKYNCVATIHMDPVAVDDPEVQAMKERVTALVQGIDPELGIHDFRMVKGPTHTNLIFDVTVPFRFRLPDPVVGQTIRDRVRQMEGNYFAVVRVEHTMY